MTTQLRARHIRKAVKVKILALAVMGLIIAGLAHAAPLPTQRVSAVQQIVLAWDPATNFADGVAIQTNDYYRLSTRIWKCTPGWTGDPLTNAVWSLTATVPYTQQIVTVSVAVTGVWAFAAQHVYVDAGATNDSAFSDILIWTNRPLIPGSPRFR